MELRSHGTESCWPWLMVCSCSPAHQHHMANRTSIPVWFIKTSLWRNSIRPHRPQVWYRDPLSGDSPCDWSLWGSTEVKKSNSCQISSHCTLLYSSITWQQLCLLAHLQERLELSKAKNIIIQNVQPEVYLKEFKCKATQRYLPTQSLLLKLHSIIDSDGLLCVRRDA